MCVGVVTITHANTEMILRDDKLSNDETVVDESLAR